MSSEAEHGGGGGHGGSWIVTYSDMITLLIACFIMIITFASRETDNFGRKRDSLLYGSGGTGAVGEEMRSQLDKDAIVWRERPPLSRLGQGGSEMPPIHSDPTIHSPSEMLRTLETDKIGTLLDSYGMRVPLGLLFQSDGKISPSGVQVLRVLASNIRQLPFDIEIQVEDSGQVGRAVALAQHLARQETIHPGRMGVGVRPSDDPQKASVWFVMVRRPSRS